MIAARNMPVWLSESACGRSSRIAADCSDKLDGHPAFPGCFKKEQKTNLALLDISDLGAELEHTGGRAKDE